jgi:hypothetical protein
MVTLLQPSQGCSTPGTRPLTADRPPAEVAVWNHPIRVTTVPPGRVQGEYHGETPGGEGRERGRRRYPVGGRGRRPPLALRLDHGGQSPPVTRWPRTAAAVGTWWAVSSSTSARHRRASTEDGGGGGPDPSEVHPLANEAASRPLDQPPPGHRYRVPVHRRRDDARRRAEPPRPGEGAARPRLASRAGHWRMRGQPGANQTWWAASTVSTPQRQQGSDDRWAPIGRPLYR